MKDWMPLTNASSHPDKQPAKRKKIAGDAFAMLRETALMVANDPLYLPKETQPPSVVETTTTTSTTTSTRTTTTELSLDETIRQHVAADSTYDDLPPLESCSEEEDDNEVELDVKTTQQETLARSRNAESAVPKTPPFTVKETATCRSYLVDVRGVDKNSVALSFPSPISFRLVFEATSIDGERAVNYELSIADLAQPMDVARAEWHVASENLVVILYKRENEREEVTPSDLERPPVVVGRFQNELLYELD
ncbi:hypothetical protein PINS_up010636 [Pythium insidiosum]|nr:hypothetical protein PINS_up010636 [Pythium insidiosum]